jgi:Protein kinase domain
MTPRDWDRIKVCFDELEGLSPAGRLAFLSRVRLDEPSLLDDLEKLLIHAGHESGLLDSPAIGLIHSAFRSVRSLSLAGNQETDPCVEGETLLPQSERFRIIRKLGSGGMGTVYEVLDTFLSSRVAAKTLRRATGLGISLFKQEFRSLANIHHPNLVSLYEFITEGDLWFYTMELIPGIGLIDYVAHAADGPSERISLIRQTLTQLCDGIAAIHCGRQASP